MNIHMNKWRMMLKVAGIVLVLIIMKIVVEFFNLDLISISPLITAFVGGVIFIIAFILAGTLSDYKEAEKIPGELAASIKTLYKDVRIACAGDEKMASDMHGRIKELVGVINSNFRHNNWKQSEVNSVVDVIDDDILELSTKGTPPQFTMKLRTELTNIDKISNRIETIKETSFIPAAYSIAQLAIGMAIATLLFTKIDPYFEGLTLFGVISLLLVSLILLIKDMDDPFEVGKKTYADVDLDLMYKLEEYLKDK